MEQPRLRCVATSESFLKWEHDWIINWCLADFNVDIRVDAKPELEAGTVLITAGTAEHLTPHLRKKLRSAHDRNRPLCVIHLGDEYATDDLTFYRECSHVFRNYFRGDLQKHRNCSLFPLGYRSGFLQGRTERRFDDRSHRWAFAGQAKGERNVMLDQMSRWALGAVHLTEQWDDPQGLRPDFYARLIFNTRLVPSPRGNLSVESFRFYEALEAGAVPVVEDTGGGLSALVAWIKRNGFREAIRQNGRQKVAECFGGSYWRSMFGSNLPFPRVVDWSNVEELLTRADVEHVAKAVGAWWQKEKQQVRAIFREKINEAVDVHVPTRLPI